VKDSNLDTGSVFVIVGVRPGDRTGEKYGGMSLGENGVNVVDWTLVNCTLWGLIWGLHREKLERTRVNCERGRNMLHEHVYLTMHETREASL
jgi:hypothetical protein